MKTLFRAVNELYIDGNEPLNGIGAKLYGGRLNPQGLEALYLSQDAASAILEVLKHSPTLSLENYYVVEIEIPEDSILIFDKKDLPVDWKNNYIPISTQKIGEKFLIEKQFLALKFPSAIVPDSYNFVLNPRHSSFNQVKIVKRTSLRDFGIDENLFNNKKELKMLEILDKVLKPFQ